MRILTLTLCLFFVATTSYAVGCKTNLKDTDATSKFIEALQCLHDEINIIKNATDAAINAAKNTSIKADSATNAADRARKSAEEISSKLDKLFKETSVQNSDAN